MIGLLLDILRFDLRRIHCWRSGHQWTHRTDPVCCLRCRSTVYH